ncbi:MAG: hypothetical protein G01um101438_300 [Parcubacteria group bacterium Gr01-1014_38]|nr:MAG: hypothetical protein G01um101438_300 [Parcubacteria group bacterium Gr01-1014_38]
MAAYIGPLLLVLVGLGGLIFLIGRRVRTGAAGEPTSADVVLERAAGRELQLPAARARSGQFAGIGKRIVASLYFLGRSGRLVFRVSGGVMRVVLRRPLARVPSVSSPTPFPKPDLPAQPLPPPVSDSVTAPKVSERGTVRMHRESTPESLDILDELAPSQREISIPKPWTPMPLKPSASKEITPRTTAFDDQEDFAEIAPMPSVSLDEVESPEHTGNLEPEPPSDAPLAAPLAPPVTAGPATVPESDQHASTPVTPARVPPPEETSLTLEPHVRERAIGRQKVVGRVRASRKGESARSRKHGISPPLTPRTTSPSVTEVVEEGIESIPALLAGGQLARAEDILTDLLSTNPRDLAAYRWLALVYIQRGEYAQAREVCEEGLRRDPDGASLCGPLGRAYVGLGQYGKALQMYQRAHNSDEANLEYLEQLLLIASRMDHRALARVTAEKILALQPDHPLATKHLARVRAVV